MRAVLTGSRNWQDEAIVRTSMERLLERGLVHVSVGDCPTGVDAIVRRWCNDAGLTPLVFVAEWGKFGNKAGPLRNQAMVDAGADICIGFMMDDGSRGTKDCVSRAIKAGIKTFVYSEQYGDWNEYN